MQAQRLRMRCRVSKRYGRTPGQHGNTFIPPYYPVGVDPGFWGTPWAKIAENGPPLVYAIIFPMFLLWAWDLLIDGRMRIGQVAPRVVCTSLRRSHWLDMDDPDFFLKEAALNEEIGKDELNVNWGGSNYLTSYLWQPGDPEPDKRRRYPANGIVH